MLSWNRPLLKQMYLGFAVVYGIFLIFVMCTEACSPECLFAIANKNADEMSQLHLCFWGYDRGPVREGLRKSAPKGFAV